MIISVVSEDKREKLLRKIKSSNESDSTEIRRLKELLNEEELEYVSPNIRNILNIVKPNNPNCFTKLVDKNRVKALLNGAEYRVILYIRLSVEDGDIIDGDVSKSIRNQLLILLDECRKRKWKVVAIFCEEGISGANDNRPEWHKSLTFCECGRTEIVLCKSQSRFSRSMEMIEKYLHNEFVKWNIRFVGLVDSADTSVKGNKKSRQINALVNEWQVEDQSINTREILKNRKSNGLYAAAFAPYGYKKDPDDKYHLIIDEEASKIVKEIFDKYAKGIGYFTICNELNYRRVPIPSDHKRISGSKYYNWNLQYKRIITYQTEVGDTLKKIADKYYSDEKAIYEANNLNEENFISNEEKTNFENKELKAGQVITLPTRQIWSSQTIREILRNETYTGTLVLGKWRNKSYKDRSRIKVPKEEWIRVPHCHTPIISQETWNIVAERFAEDGRNKITKNGEINIFGKKAYCACCGKGFYMTSTDKRRKNVQHYLRCNQSNATNHKLCSNSKLIEIENLKNMVLAEINKQIDIYYDMSEIEKSYKEQKSNNNIENEIQNLNIQKTNIEKEISKKTNTLSMLYEDRANGIITAEEFSMIKSKNNLDIENYKIRINDINNTLYELNKERNKKENNKKLFSKYRKIEKLDRMVLDEFVSKIYIGKYNEETKERELEIIWNINAY